MSNYTTRSAQLASFIFYVLGHDSLQGVTFSDGTCTFTFNDSGKCQELARSYLSESPTEDIAATRDLIRACYSINRAIIDAKKQNTKKKERSE
jgi:hypothetical protein